MINGQAIQLKVNNIKGYNFSFLKKNKNKNKESVNVNIKITKCLGGIFRC